MSTNKILPDENSLDVYLITWVTHNSRISERMVKFGVKKGSPVIFNEAMRTAVFKWIKEKIGKENYRALELNVLDDHVHLVLACNENELDGIVRNLKGYSSYLLGRQLNLSVEGEGRKSKIWGVGYSHTWLQSERHIENALEYVRNNLLKHNLSPLKDGLQWIVDEE